MNYRIIAIYLLLLATPIFNKEEEPVTEITYLVEEDGQQDQDFIEMTLLIKISDTSLASAIKSAAKVAQNVEDAVQKYCQKEQQGQNCDEAIEVGKPQIQAKYQLIRKILTFKTFIVSHEVTIKVTNVQKIGSLVDKVRGYDVSEIQSLEWLPNDEKDSAVEAFKKGLEQGKAMCKMIGQTFGKIISVEEVKQQPEEQQEPQEQEQEEQQQEEEEEQAPIVYQFTAQCIPKK